MRARDPIGIFLALLLGTLVPASLRAEEPIAPDHLRNMSLEELMEMTVVSASRSEQALEDVAAAVYVISREDIANSKVRTIAEALRQAPGLQVGQIDANRWAVGSRGFNSRYTNKLLVLVDGRSVYTPLFSGVHWGVEDLPLEIVDRIEVIRGPGASVWGSNAVNGVINIITRPASDLQGHGVKFGAGVEENAFGEGWVAGAWGENVDLRLAAKSFSRDAYTTSEPLEAHDAWNLGRANLRLDWQRSEETDLTFIADAHQVGADHTLAFSRTAPPWRDIQIGELESRGASLLGRWVHRRSDRATWSGQTYLDWVDRDGDVLQEDRTTWDGEVQLELGVTDHSNLMLGGNYRISADKIGSPHPEVDFGVPERTDRLWSSFVQWQWRTAGGRLGFTLGTKYEDHPYTDPEWQPTARVIWSPNESQSIWGAVSRAVRSPSRSEIGGSFDFGAYFEPGQPVFLVEVEGNPEMGSEELVAWELGYRFVPERRLSLDVAAFVNRYDDLMGIQTIAVETFSAPAPGYILATHRIINSGRATAWGGEVSARWQVAPRLRINGFYAYIDVENEDIETSQNVASRFYRHGVMLRSELDLASDWRLDTMFHLHSPLAGLGDPEAVQRLDAALSWRMRSDLEFSLVGQSLLHSSQTEFEHHGWELGTEVERTVFAMFRWGR